MSYRCLFIKHKFLLGVITFVALALLLPHIVRCSVDNTANLLLVQQTLALAVVNETDLSLKQCDSRSDIFATQAWTRAKGWLLSHGWTEAKACLELYLKKQGQQSNLILFTVALLAARQGDWKEAAAWIAQMPQNDVRSVQLVSSAYQLAAAGDLVGAEVNLRQAKAYFDALPLFTELYEEGQDQLQLVRLRQRPETAEDQLSLATQYWRSADYAIAGSLAEALLARYEELSARQRAWAWYIVAAGFQETGQSDQVLLAYQAGIAADPTLIANYWDALNWVESHSEVKFQDTKALEVGLENIYPEGQLRQWPTSSSILLGYTVVPGSDLAPDATYDVYLFWTLGTPYAIGTKVRRTSQWNIQRLRLRNQVALGHFDFDEQKGKIIPGWEEFLYAKELGEASIQSTPGASGGALQLVPNDSNPVGLRGVPPLTGIPVQPRRHYLLTGRMRVDQTGVASIRCIWYTSNQEALELDAQGVPSYFEVYNGEWTDSGVLLMAPPLARSCELRAVYGVGTGKGWFDDIRLFELPNIGGG